MMMEDRQYNSWGRVRRINRPVAAPEAILSADTVENDLLPFGNGRSYGDSCHNDQGRLIPMRSDNQIHGLDPETGILIADPGITLQEILAAAIPEGLFLEVTPGTALATLGGAVANDVHGKNHHRRGSFGHSVISFDLLRSDGQIYHCNRTKNADLFRATIGGMGLTGLIKRVVLRLMKVNSANLEQKSWRFGNIDGYFDAIDALDAKHEYSVAWIDQLATGASTGRGVLMVADHAENGGVEQMPKPARVSVPFQPPVNLLNRLTLKAFNGLYFGRAPKAPTTSLVGWGSYFHPLDAIGNWNRLYGPKGLFQHQSVFPVECGRETTLKLMECARNRGHASFLTVLKRFGTIDQPGLFSFARPGFTLTLDFANQGPATLEMLDALDELVLEAGGALNPYKDQRMSPKMFAATFANWQELEALRDPKIMSDFWRRTAMQMPEQLSGGRQGLSQSRRSRIKPNTNHASNQSGNKRNLNQFRARA